MVAKGCKALTNDTPSPSRSLNLSGGRRKIELNPVPTGGGPLVMR
jgi:hypothetical protein